MNYGDNIERSIAQMCVTETVAIDERILGDAFIALEESVRLEWGGVSPSVGRLIARSSIGKSVAAAIIIIAVFVGISALTGPRRQPTEKRSVTAQIEMEKQQITVMLTARDVDGLVRMLSQGQFESSKVYAALCLGEIGDVRALGELERLYLAAEVKLPEGFAKNPFAEPLEKIRSRIRATQGANKPVVDANRIAALDANGTVPVDVNKIDVDANTVGMPNAPAKREGVINFKVIDKQSREPIADVEVAVKIQRAGPDDRFKLTTNKMGLVVINVGDRDTKYIQIDVSKKKYVPMEIFFRRKDDLIEVPQDYTLLLECATSIGGFVQNEQGEPIESVKVGIYVRIADQKKEGPRMNLNDQQAVTDANGFWRFDGLPGDFEEIYLRLSHADYVDDQSYGATPTPPLEKLRDMTAVAVMERGVAVFGRVVDAAGKPVAKAKVMQGDSRYSEPPETETDSEGRFEFAHARTGAMILTVQADGYAPALKEVSVHEGMADVDFKLGPPRTIRGRVVDSNNNPLEGVGVSATNWRGYRSVDWQSKTNSDGYFEWNGAPADEVMFDFYKQDYMSVRQMPMSAGIDEYVIEMYPPLKVSGTVVDADSNEPVKNFKVITGIKWQTSTNISWDTRSAVESADGRYEHTFKYPYDGHLIRIEAEGYLPGVSRLFYNDEGTVVYNFRLSKGQGPAGYVYLPNGEPASNAEVIVCTPSQGVYMQNGKNNQRGTVSTVTDAEGHFALAPQTENFTLVVMHDDGYAEANEADLADSNGIVLQNWGRVEGVLRIGSKAGSNENISLYYNRSYSPNAPKINFNYKTVTDANGYFEFDRVRPGSARVARVIRLSRRSTTNSQTTSVEVKPGQTVSVAIGGMGRPVIGQIVVPADYNEPVNFSSGHSSLQSMASIPPQPPYPENFYSMSQRERIQWLVDWQKTDEGKSFTEQNLFPKYPENAADMTMEELQAWSKQWQQSEKGKAFMKRMQEVQKKQRNYAVQIQPDGSFRVDDVPAGKYQLQIYIYDRPFGSYSGSRRPEITGSLTHEFEVPDMNELVIDKPLDVGTLTLEMKKRLKVGDILPPFEATTLDDKAIHLSDFRGKVVALHFWRSGHPQSVESLENLKEVYEAFGKNEGFAMLGLLLDDNSERTRKVVSEQQLDWPQAIPNAATRRQVHQDYGIQNVPYTFVIGRNGRILAINPSLGQMMLTVKEALKAD